MAETIDIRELDERIERQSAFVTNLTTGMAVSYTHLVQYGSQFIGNNYRHLSLNGWNVQQQYGTDIQSQYNTEYPAYCFF